MRKQSRLTAWGIIFGLFFLAFLVAVVQHDPQITILDQAGLTLTEPVTNAKTFWLLKITMLGAPQVIGIFNLLVMLYLWYRKRLGDSMWYGLVQFVGYFWVILVKYTVMRPRPANRLEKISGYSFPSGHTFATTTFVVAILVLLWPYLRRRWFKGLLIIVGMLWILVIMYTRVYLHVHYASDVCAGLLLALSWCLLIYPYQQRFMHWIQEIQK